MKTLFKRTAAAAAAAVMTLGLAGCGNNTSSNTSTSGTNSTAADSSAATSSATSNAAIGGEDSTPAGNGGTLVIGSIGPITGPAAIYGINVQNGAQLAVDEINAAGGVNGMTLELNFQDDEHDPEKSVNTYNTLKDKGMKLLVGTVTSGPCEAVSKEAAKDNMFLITPSGSSVNAITAGDNCFRMCFNDPQQGKIEADFIAEKLEGKKKVGVIYDSSDSYSTGILEGFKEEAAAKGLDDPVCQPLIVQLVDQSVGVCHGGADGLGDKAGAGLTAGVCGRCPQSGFPPGVCANDIVVCGVRFKELKGPQIDLVVGAVYDSDRRVIRGIDGPKAL